MQTAIFDVIEFHEKMGLTIGDPKSPDISKDTLLRFNLIKEEFEELREALEAEEKSPEEQLIAVADALGDIAYTVIGAAVSWGIDLAPVWCAIHESNMTKSRANRRSDGKILKGVDYRPPDIKGALEEGKQLAEQEAQGHPEDSVWSGLHEDVANPEEWVRDMALKAAREHDEPRDTEPTPVEDPAVSVSYSKGQVLARGAFVFECSCERMIEIDLHLGSRNGFKPASHSECRCGVKHTFAFEYDPRDPWDMSKVKVFKSE